MRNIHPVLALVQDVHKENAKRLFSIMFVRHSGIWGNSWEVVLNTVLLLQKCNGVHIKECINEQRKIQTTDVQLCTSDEWRK